MSAGARRSGPGVASTAPTVSAVRIRGSAERSQGCVAAAACALVAGAACKRDPALGPPDSFLVVAPVPPRTAPPVKSKAGLPVVASVPLDDPHAVPLHQQLAIGFAGEVLRTDYLAKQLVRDIDVGGRRYGERPRAVRPRADRARPGRRARRAARRRRAALALKGSFGGEDEHADALGSRSTPTPTTIARCRRRWPARSACWPASRVADRRRAEPPASAGRRLRAGAGGDRARVAGRGGARGGAARRTPARAAQRELFAAVRENRYVLGADGAPRPAAELLADPGVTATVLYRLAQSKSGRAQGRARRGLRAVREGPRPRGRQPGGGAGPVPQLPGEAALGLGARRAGGQAARATSPIWSTPTGARCPRSGRRSSASSSSPPSARR